MRDPELTAAAESLKGSHRRVLEVLVLAGSFLETLEDDPQAAWLAGEIAKAFDAMVVENIAAATVVAEHRKGATNG